MSKFSTNKYFTGTSGLLLPVANKSFYPPAYQDKSRLQYYASLFSSIEINSSFYKIPLAATIKKWAFDVPDNFRFTFKLYKEITHAKELNYNPMDLEKFMDNINQVANKSACLLLQFPASFKVKNLQKLELLIAAIRLKDTNRNWKISIEFRNEEWYNEEVYEVLEAHLCGLVVHDKGGYGSGYHDTATDWVYLRFHGPDGNYKGSYDESFLAEYAGYIKDWLKQGKSVYTYFNNTMGEALNNLDTLKRYVCS
ncbi:DUF72 domain-containing protein [Pedobacter rhodius]|uniref:DUF72 domain-containing protein n=1 Tax=Pedobacter rhodius TaxID=3004098 RepID=A0ABT4KUD6_9SPHI|nr:DUF72 domain-containing protein [Pedobacter sp. SJ11]MCZ4222540.1 DUF72 domain-containing protein [Pedobacter sp. SJ11]